MSEGSLKNEGYLDLGGEIGRVRLLANHAAITALERGPDSIGSLWQMQQDAGQARIKASE